MVVKIDLRIPGRETRSERESDFRHVAVFSAAMLFILTVAAVYSIGIWRLYGIKQDIITTKVSITGTSDKVAVMDRELERIASETRIMDDKLNFMLSDLPSIEFMTNLSKIMPERVFIESIAMTKDKVVLSGSGPNETEILAFANNLSLEPYISSVSVPNITQGKTAGIMSRIFNLECRLDPLADILQMNLIPKIDNGYAVSEDILL